MAFRQQIYQEKAMSKDKIWHSSAMLVSRWNPGERNLQAAYIKIEEEIRRELNTTIANATQGDLND